RAQRRQPAAGRLRLPGARRAAGAGRGQRRFPLALARARLARLPGAARSRRAEPGALARLARVHAEDLRLLRLDRSAAVPALLDGTAARRVLAPDAPMARYGVLGDIHGNREALAAVLGALEARGIREFLCVGDVVGYNADPDECAAELRRRRVLSIAGNHDLIGT